PVQALQLARVAAMFNRDLGGLRFFTGQLSNSGIDRIDLRTGEKIDDAAVGLGKYFTDSVYVEVEQGTTSDSGRISVEVELSPQLSIKGDVDARDRSGVGLFWRKDY
ncbi:MAG TPA: translocation/assembly module TamB domain-containing protein, partial [Candidatus Hydrogenedentes bacterium]|nr:translocation/assembly module TamB domain-containing protein [Candidatus Hydrogenedentota bacterium]